MVAKMVYEKLSSAKEPLYLSEDVFYGHRISLSDPRYQRYPLALA